MNFKVYSRNLPQNNNTIVDFVGTKFVSTDGNNYFVITEKISQQNTPGVYYIKGVNYGSWQNPEYNGEEFTGSWDEELQLLVRYESGRNSNHKNDSEFSVSQLWWKNNTFRGTYWSSEYNNTPDIHPQVFVKA